MQYTLTFTEDTFGELADAVFSDPNREGAAYVLCGISVTKNESRLLAREVVCLADEHYLVRARDRLSISSDSYVPVAKRARTSHEGILFVHSHPPHLANFSSQDDREDPRLMAFFESRAPGIPYGAMVLGSRTAFRVRLWVRGAWKDVTRVRIIGRRFHFSDFGKGEALVPHFFDRQVEAFGPEVQRLLRRLHVGVVGAGGTGSAVIEQLTRLGVGTLSVFDGDTFEASNATRVYGSSTQDMGKAKVDIQQKNVRRIRLNTDVRVFPRYITEEATAQRLRDCDLVFGCTDKQAPRGILVRLSHRYLIPCFDMAVKIQSERGVIRGIWGRVTALQPGEACLFCRGTIDPDTIRAESLPPEQREREIEDGYIAGLPTQEPAVVAFTTAVASQAVAELMHRLTGFMGEDRRSSEVLMLFHEGSIRTNRQQPQPECLCQQREFFGIGDTHNFLGLVWP